MQPSGGGGQEAGMEDNDLGRSMFDKKTGKIVNQRDAPERKDDFVTSIFFYNSLDEL